MNFLDSYHYFRQFKGVNTNIRCFQPRKTVINHARIQRVLLEEVQQLTMFFVFFYEGREDPNSTKSGPSSIEWRFTGGPVMAQH